MTDGVIDDDEPAALPPEIREQVPTWDDEYLDRIADRLMYSYDLEREYEVEGERFALYGEMRLRREKQFLHPALHYADHETKEYVFARRNDRPTVAEVRRLVDVGHDIADERVEGHEEHYGTDVTFVVVAESIPEDVRSFVSGFRDRTLLKYGYHGHYEVTLVVVAPDAEAVIASDAATITDAFVLWEDLDEEAEGILSRFARRFWR